MFRWLKFIILGGLIVVTTSTSWADSFLVTLDTSPLSGPQTLAFGLTNSDSGLNTVSLTAFTFDGGSAIAGTEDCTLGGTLSGLGCSGDLSSGVTLQDEGFLVFFSQQFTPGASLSFNLTTTNAFVGGTPDAFAMYVADGAFTTIYSDDTATGAMLLLDLAGGTLSPSAFVLYGASEQYLPAPVVTAIPEPGTLLLLGTGLACSVAAGRKRLARRSRNQKV